MRDWDIDPQDIDPETNRPYAGYSSPALDTSFHDHEMDVEDKCSHGVVVSEPCSSCQGDLLLRGTQSPVPRMDDEDDDSYPPECTSRRGHVWVFRDDDEEISYCENCGADGNA